MELPENAQTIAGLIALVSVAIFTVEVMIISRLWHKLDTCFFGIPVERKRYLGKFVFIMVAAFVAVIGVYTVAGVHDPQNATNYTLMVVLVILLVLVLVLVVRGLISLRKRLILWIRGAKKKSEGKKEVGKKNVVEKREKIDGLPLLFVTGSVFLIIGMFCDLFALFGVSATMLDINIGIYNAENYRWGVWLMMDAVFFFVVGVTIVGAGYLSEKWRL